MAIGTRWFLFLCSCKESGVSVPAKFLLLPFPSGRGCGVNSGTCHHLASSPQQSLTCNARRLQSYTNTHTLTRTHLRYTLQQPCCRCYTIRAAAASFSTPLHLDLPTQILLLITHTHTHTCTHTHTQACTHKHTHIPQTCTQTLTHTHSHTHIRTHAHTHKHIPQACPAAAHAAAAI